MGEEDRGTGEPEAAEEEEEEEEELGFLWN